MMLKLKDNIDTNNMKLGELVYLYENEIYQLPVCFCGEKVKFIKYSKGYNKFCSKSCSAKHSHMNSEIKQKRLIGLNRSNSDPKMREKMTQKSIETKKSFSVAKKLEINKKREKTTLDKYGVKNIATLSKKEKVNKRLNNLKENIESENYSLRDFNHSDNLLELECKKCKCGERTFNIDRGLFFRRRLTGIKECMNINPKKGGNSKYEFEIMEILDEYKISYTHRYKIDNNEIDIYIPEYNIGIEFNGLYWHSELYKEKKYHINKTNYFKERGIRIIHIWEDEWIYNNDKIVDYLLSILGKNDKIIYGRKCDIREVSKKETHDFLNENHLQGKLNIYKTSIGLYHNNQLVSIIVMGDLRNIMGRKKTKGVSELLRFCNKRRHTIHGSFSKLFKYYLNNFQNNKIITYSNISKFEGNIYKLFGFEYIRKTNPNYYYLDPKNSLKKYNRWSFRKDKLIRDGYDQNKTEHQIMNELGYYRIYDCGNYLFEYMI